MDAGVKLGEKDEYPLIEDSELKRIDGIVITHAHLDHCGYLPHVFSHGYEGKVYATKPTEELINIAASDYMRISKPQGIGKGAIPKMIKHYVQLEYHQQVPLKDMKIKLVPAGHILGSAMVEVTEQNGNAALYTGDINLKTTRLLDPAYTEYLKAKTLITETTYGGNNDTFPAEHTVLSELVKTIKETIARGGKVIVPSFAVGRAQEVLFVLDDYMRSGILPKVPIYIDGSIDRVMRIYRHNVINCKSELQKRILMSDEDPFKSVNFHFVKGRQERSKIMKSPESAIVVTTSGMLKGGPIVHYLKALSGREEDKLILVGYQAHGTPGREIQEGKKDVEFDGKKLDIKMKVETYHLSAHADRPQLMKLIGEIKGLENVFAVHGEETKIMEMTDSLKKSYYAKAPVLKETFEA